MRAQQPQTIMVRGREYAAPLGSARLHTNYGFTYSLCRICTLLEGLLLSGNGGRNLRHWQLPILTTFLHVFPMDYAFGYFRHPAQSAYSCLPTLCTILVTLFIIEGLNALRIRNFILLRALAVKRMQKLPRRVRPKEVRHTAIKQVIKRSVKLKE